MGALSVLSWSGTLQREATSQGPSGKVEQQLFRRSVQRMAEVQYRNLGEMLPCSPWREMYGRLNLVPEIVMFCAVAPSRSHRGGRSRHFILHEASIPGHSICPRGPASHQLQ